MSSFEGESDDVNSTDNGEKEREMSSSEGESDDMNSSGNWGKRKRNV